MTVDLNLDDAEQHRLQHTLSGYGAVITGGTPPDRESVLREYMDKPVISIDCHDIDSMDAFYHAVMQKTDRMTEDQIKKHRIDAIDARRAITDGDGVNVLIHEFDSLPEDVQQSVAQFFKGLAERRSFDGQIGYTCMEGDSVVTAEFDLASRVQTWNID